MENDGFWERGRKGFWPDVSTIEGAKLAVKYGWVASFIVACVTTISIPLGWTTESSIVDAVIFLVIGYGIFRNSRIASIIGAVFLSLELLFKLQEGKSIGIGFLFLLYFINGVRGTFAHYRLTKSR